MAVEQASHPDWASLAPGTELNAQLSDVDLTAVPDDQLAGLLRGCWRQISQLHARCWATMVEIGHREPPGDPHAWRELESWEWGSNQVAAALTLTTHRADHEYRLAHQLVQKLPAVWEALHAGAIDPAKATVFARHLAELDAPQATRICERLLPAAPGWTTGQLAHRLLREILAADPGYARRRYRTAVRERGVWGYLAEDGSAVLSAHGLTPTQAAAAAERLEDLAAAVRSAGHLHTQDQLRADLFVRLLDGRYTGYTRDQIITAMLTDPEHATPEPAETAQPEPTQPEPTQPEPGATSPGSPASHSNQAPTPNRAASPSEPDTGRSPDPHPDPDPDPVRDRRPDDGVSSDDVEPTGPTEPITAPAGRAAAETQPPPQERPSTSMPEHRPTPVWPTLPLPPEGMRYGIEVRIGLPTLLGVDDHPAELPGWGPINAEDARALVARQHRAEWRFAVLDDDGYLLFGGITRRRPDLGTTRRTDRTRGGVVEIHIRSRRLAEFAVRDDLPPRWAPVIADITRQYRDRRAARQRPGPRPRARFPNAGLRRHIQMRDRTCVAPGCRRPARKVEQDHTVDHACGGPTEHANLGPLCARHHRMKHYAGWTLTQPLPGLFRWHSPLGQIYPTRGEPIAPDLPEPIRKPDDEPPEPDDDQHPPARSAGPIIDPTRWARAAPPEPDPPPSEPDDEPPPF